MLVTRVAAIYDIHGNLPALEAVLHEIRQTDVDQIVVGGDVIPGPMPRETLACLRDLEIPVRFIHGNGEREVLAQRAGIESAAIPEGFREVMRWVAGELDPANERWLAGWPDSLLTVALLAVSGVGIAVALFGPRSIKALMLAWFLFPCRFSKGSTRLWSSAVIPTCSSTARSATSGS